MPYVNVGQENSGQLNLYYEDHGDGKPVVLIHGFPLNAAAWEKQIGPLLSAGHRVIAYDRRGFGRSSQPSTGYDYDTFAADLHKLITRLELRDVTLVGHSMGTGEITRYLGTYGSKLVKKAVMISAIAPFLLKTADNPEGVDASVFDGIKRAIVADRYAYQTNFVDNFFNVDVFGGTLVSPEVVHGNWNIAVGASPKGTYDCVNAWLTDFRKDVPRIDVPTLIIHGDADRILPIDPTSNRLVKMIKGVRLVTIPKGPHGIAWTHADVVNRALLEFVG